MTEDEIVDDINTRAALQGWPIADQPPPEPADGDVWKLVIADMEQRHEVGIERYGTPLQVDNGRDHLVDAYQENLDQAVYLRAEIERRRQRARLMGRELAELFGRVEWDKLSLPQRDAWIAEAAAILEKIGG